MTIKKIYLSKKPICVFNCKIFLSTPVHREVYRTSITRSRGRESGQNCRVTGELLAYLNWPRSESREGSVGRRVVVVKFPIMCNVGQDTIKPSFECLDH